MLGEVGGEDEADGGLDLGGADGRLLVGTDEGAGLGGDLVEHVIDEGVEDLDRLGREGEALLGVLVDAVDEGVEARGVALAARTALLVASLLSDDSLGHFFGLLVGFFSKNYWILFFFKHEIRIEFLKENEFFFFFMKKE